MKRIIACILVVISLFFGVACKEKEETIQYEEGHIFLTEEMMEETIKVFVKCFYFDKYGFDFSDKKEISKEKYRYYADSFDMGFEKILTYKEGNQQGWFCAEYRDEATAIFYENQFNGKETKCFRYRNILIYDLYPMYFILDLQGEYESRDEYKYILTKDKKRFLDISQENSMPIPSFQIPNGVESLVGLSLAYNPAETVVCNDTIIEILLLAAIYNSVIRTIVLNNGLKKIGTEAFYGCENFEYTVIPLSVERVGREAFTHGNIFCEVESKPDGWADNFYCEQAKVYWKGEWEYDENGNPVPIAEEVPPIDGGETV